MNTMLINRKLNDGQINRLISIGSEDDPVLIAICADISPNAQYSPCVLLATKTHVFTYDLEKDEASEKYAFEDIENIYNKRMYGNGVMRIVLKTGERKDLFRFTFSVTALCDSAVTYVKDVRDGVSAEEAYGVMEAVFEKSLSVCPKCGRMLRSIGLSRARFNIGLTNLVYNPCRFAILSRKAKCSG